MLSIESLESRELPATIATVFGSANPDRVFMRGSTAMLNGDDMNVGLVDEFRFDGDTNDSLTVWNGTGWQSLSLGESIMSDGVLIRFV